MENTESGENVVIIEKNKYGQKNKNRNKILAGIDNVELKKTEHQLVIPSHRKRNQISFEEYKKLLKEGKTIGEISEITSKHIVNFYNILLKGSIKLNKEDFEKMYSDGMTLDEIAEKNNISRENMTFLRDFYGIKRRGANYQKRIGVEKPLSQDAKDIIIGSLLGDGHITKGGYFSEKHSQAQLDYLRWKADYLKEISTEKSWGYYECISKKTGSLLKSHAFRTKTHSFLYEMRKKFYKYIDGKWIKTMDDSIFNMINEKILAIWFMDDGITNWGYRRGIKKTKNSRPSVKLCTDSFSKTDMNKLINMLSSKFNVKSYIGDRNRITFSTEETEKFLKIVSPYAHSDLLYKFFEDSYVEKMTKRQKL